MTNENYRSHQMSGVVIPFAVLASIIGMGLLAMGCGGGGGGGGAGPTGAAGTTTTNTVLGETENLPGLVLAIVSVTGGTRSDGSFQAGDTINVRFTVKKNDGTNLALSEVDDARIFVSGPSFNYQRVMARQSDVKTRSVQNTDNSYTYTFAAAIPTTYLAPYNDTTAFTDGELTGQTLLSGTYTAGMYVYKNYTVDGVTFKDVGNATKDFSFGGATLEAREVVTLGNCNQCHVTLQAHSGTRRDTKLCILCHTAGAEDSEDALVTPGVTIEFKVMVHKIHNGAHLPSVLGVGTNPDGTRNYAATATPYVIDHDGELQNYSEVGFPVWPNMSIAMPKDQGYSALTSAQKTTEDKILKGVTDCHKCHEGAAQEGLHESQPSRRVCGSCHDDINWAYPYVANGQTMPVQANDSACATCHTDEGTSLSVEDAHKHPINNTANNPGTVFSITSTSGGSGAGGNFQAGDSPSITFTVKDSAGTDTPLGSLDRVVVALVGPTINRQMVTPSAGFPTIDPWDFSGRLNSSSTSNKGTMSKVVPTGTPVTETLTVQFTSITAFTVTGSVNGALGASALGTATSTNPSGSSISALLLTNTAVAQTITVSFTSATAFTVTGSVSGAMGSGTLPNATSGSTRFTSTDGTLAFNITVGTTAFVTGNNIYLTIFKGAAANPVLFAIVAGRTAFATGDRFYYDFVAPASSYTKNLSMDLTLEFLGDGNGAVGQVLTAGNLPVYYGRQTLYERTALVGTSTTLTANASALARYVDVTAVAGTLTYSDYAVLDDGLATEEYLQVGYIDTALKRIWFKTPLRFAHTSATGTFQEVTLTFRQEGTNYTLTAGTGTVASLIAFGAGNALIMNYRTDGRFGWYRYNGDTRQTTYPPPPYDSPDLGQDWGEWAGLSFQDATYTLGLWGSLYVDFGLNNEVQTYRMTTLSSRVDILYGSASTVTPYGYISSGENCNTCHSNVMFHGGGYRGAETCLLCHGIAGMEDRSHYGSTTPATQPATTGATVNYRTMLHKIHMGEDLANAATYQIGSYTFGEIVFPAMPGKTKHCDKCHGSTNSSWKEPSDRTHASQTTPTRKWRAVCGSCHDSSSTGAHIDSQTVAGVEACATCHGIGKEFQVELMHKNR